MLYFYLFSTLSVVVSLSYDLSDSDIVLDLCEQFDESKKITYVYFDTGLEFEATKRHLNYLEEDFSNSGNVEKSRKE